MNGPARHGAPDGCHQALRVVAAAVIDQNRCLIARRGPEMSLPGRWEFPGGKVEADEAPPAALVRELSEELGLLIVVEEWLARSELLAPRPLRLDLYRATWVSGEPRATEHAEIRWVTAGELAAFDWAEADRPLLPAVRAALLAT